MTAKTAKFTSLKNLDVYGISKNNQHRFKDTNASNKELKVYALPDNFRCMVRLLDKYLQKLPPDAEYVYMRPMDKIPMANSPTNSWYTKQRVGYNTLKGFIPKLFATIVGSRSLCGQVG